MRVNNINNFHIFNNQYKPIKNTQTRFVSFAGQDSFNQQEKDFINPVTKQYDKKIEKMAKDLLNRSASKHIKLAKTGIDASTGEYSPYFKKLMSYCFPTNTDKLFSNTKTGIGSKVYHRSDNIYKIPDLVTAMKDKKGDIAKENYEFVEKSLIAQYKTHSVDIKDIITLMNKIKDENGIVNKKELGFVEELYHKRGVYLNDTLKAIDHIRTYPEDKQQEIFNTVMKQRPYKNSVEYSSDFDIRSKFCFDENGERIEDNIKIVNTIDSKRHIIYSKDTEYILSLCKDSKDFQDVFFKAIEFVFNNANFVSKVIRKYLDENGNMKPKEKNAMLEILPYNKDLSDFEDIMNKCYSFNSEKEGDELFKKISSFIKLNYSIVASGIHNFEGIYLCAGEIPYTYTTILDKLLLYKKVKNIYNISTEKPNKEEFAFLKDIIEMLEKEINITNLALPIPNETKKLAINTIFNSTNNELTDFENTIKSSIPTLKKYPKGLPLKYSREDFTKDLNELLKKDYEGSIKFIQKDLGFNGYPREYFNDLFEDDEFEDDEPYELMCETLTLPDCFYANGLKIKETDSELQKEIKTLAKKFLYENEVQTGNKELDKELNLLIKTFPEFVNMIGRKQHQTHDYSLDIHTLLVLANILNDDNYKNLNANERLTIKSVALFHDICKKEEIADNKHPKTSANAAKSILSKIYTNKEQLDRVYNLIQYHNFFDRYENSGMKEKLETEYSFAFRRPNDFELAKLFTKADLKAVSDDFYDEHINQLSTKNLRGINKKLNEYQQTGNAIFPTYIVNKTKLNQHKQTIKGREFTVINTHNIGPTQDLEEYGFETGTKKKDLRFLVHMTSDFDTLKILEQANEDSILSESFISLFHKKTYCDREYGVILKHKNYDIISTASENQGSGACKDLYDIERLLKEDERTRFSTNFLTALGIKPNNTNKKHYQEFYNNVLANCTSLNKINPDKTFNIGEKEVKGSEIIKAIKDYQDSLFSLTNKEHNEIVGFAPEVQGVIAKAKNVNKLPDKLLDFAYANNYPIIMM